MDRCVGGANFCGVLWFVHCIELVDGSIVLELAKAKFALVYYFNVHCSIALVVFVDGLVYPWAELRVHGDVIILCTAMFAVMQRDNLKSGLISLSLSFALRVNQAILYALHFTCEMETYIVAVERIRQYTEQPSEVWTWAYFFPLWSSDMTEYAPYTVISAALLSLTSLHQRISDKDAVFDKLQRSAWSSYHLQSDLRLRRVLLYTRLSLKGRAEGCALLKCHKINSS